MGWAANFCDGDTTDPASDDMESGGRIPSACSSSSDEDTERKAPWAASWKASAQQSVSTERHGEKLQDVLSQVPPPRQATSVTDATGDQLGGSRQPLPEDGLIDIDPEEGRRRGDELMAMLMTQEDTDAPAIFSTLSVNAPAFPPPKPAAVEQQHQPRQLRQPQPQTQSQCWAAAWEGCGTGGWAAEASAQESSPAITG